MKFSCEQCNIDFENKFSYLKHKKDNNKHNEHTIKKNDMSSGPAICPKCGKNFANEYLMKIHLMVHKRQENTETVKCELCDFKTKFPSNLKGHIERHKYSAAGEKSFLCTHCPM